MSIRGFLGLFADGPGKKVRASSITDENNNLVFIQAGSVSDPDSTAIANVKAGSTLPAASDNALVVTLRDPITATLSTSSVGVNNFPATQPVSATALPLPAGAALEAGGNLAEINAKLGGTLGVQTQTPTTFFAKRVVMTGSPIQMTSNALVNGLIGTAPTSNSGNIYYGPSSAAVTAIDGTGDGYPILPGASVSESLSNSNAVWLNGAAGLVIYWKGN